MPPESLSGGIFCCSVRPNLRCYCRAGRVVEDCDAENGIMPLYFAYGSNMSAQQMVSRCPSARFVDVAVLKNWELIFPRRSRRWGGGAAGIAEAPGKCVEGVVFDITDEDLALMDGFEGVDTGCYWRDRVFVALRQGGEAEVAVYFAVPQPGGPFPPHAGYLGTLITGAKEHGLSESYITWLEGMETV